MTVDLGRKYCWLHAVVGMLLVVSVVTIAVLVVAVSIYIRISLYLSHA